MEGYTIWLLSIRFIIVTLKIHYLFTIFIATTTDRNFYMKIFAILMSLYTTRTLIGKNKYSRVIYSYIKGNQYILH